MPHKAETDTETVYLHAILPTVISRDDVDVLKSVLCLVYKTPGLKVYFMLFSRIDFYFGLIVQGEREG